VTDTVVRLLDPAAGFDVPVIVWYRSGKVASHVESVCGHSADKVRRYPGYSKLKAGKYYVVTHGRGPRFTITSHYALALFGHDEVLGGSPAVHLERVGSWSDAVAVVRQRALAWRDSASARRAHGAPVGGVAAAARAPASAASTFAGEVNSDDESIAASEAPSVVAHIGGPKDGTSTGDPSYATIAEQANQLAGAANEQLRR
jgi:hypothetical protein